MLGCLKLFLHRKSDFAFRHDILECSAHTLFSINFVYVSRILTYNEYHEINRISVSYFFSCSKQYQNYLPSHTRNIEHIPLVVEAVLIQLNTLKYSKINLSPNELLIISNSVLNFDNLTDHAYLSIILIFKKKYFNQYVQMM